MTMRMTVLMIMFRMVVRHILIVMVIVGVVVSDCLAASLFVVRFQTFVE